MWFAPIVIFLPFVKRFAGITQCAKKRFISAFIPQLAVSAFDESVLLGLAQRDIVPINTIFLNPFEDRHAGELGAVIRDNRLWHAAFGDHAVQFTRNPLTRQRRVSHQH